MLDAAAREVAGRSEPASSMVVIDTHLARGASNGGFTFPGRGGRYGRTKGAKRVVAVDVAGLPVGALVVSASCHENRATELMLEHLRRQEVTDRLELVLVDRGVTAAAARALGRHHDLEPRRVGGTTSSRWSDRSGTPGTSRLPTSSSDVHDGWRSRSRTPPAQGPVGSKSPPSRPPCVTCRRGDLTVPALVRNRDRPGQAARGMRYESAHGSVDHTAFSFVLAAHFLGGAALRRARRTWTKPMTSAPAMRSMEAMTRRSRVAKAHTSPTTTIAVGTSRMRIALLSTFDAMASSWPTLPSVPEIPNPKDLALPNVPTSARPRGRRHDRTVALHQLRPTPVRIRWAADLSRGLPSFQFGRLEPPSIPRR